MKKVMGLAELQRKLAKKKKKTEGYKEGSETDKVWINFQATKKLKREFKEVCDSTRTNASDLLRKMVEAFVSDSVLVQEFLGKNL